MAGRHAASIVVFDSICQHASALAWDAKSLVTRVDFQQIRRVSRPRGRKKAQLDPEPVQGSFISSFHCSIKQSESLSHRAVAYATTNTCGPL